MKKGHALCCAFFDLGQVWGGVGVILGLYWDNGKENGSYYSILGLYWDYMGLDLEFRV